MILWDRVSRLVLLPVIKHGLPRLAANPTRLVRWWWLSQRNKPLFLLRDFPAAQQLITEGCQSERSDMVWREGNGLNYPEMTIDIIDIRVGPSSPAYDALVVFFSFHLGPQKSHRNLAGHRPRCGSVTRAQQQTREKGKVTSRYC